MIKIVINELGRIGRAALKIILDTPQLELVAVNDIVPIENIVYRLRYDTVYGKDDPASGQRSDNGLKLV